MAAFCIQDGGEDLALNHERYDSAFEQFALALKIDPNNYTIHCSEGDAHFNIGNFESAKRCYRRAIRMAPDIADTHKFYGDLLFDCEEYDQALKAYYKAARRDTDYLQVLATLKRKLKKLDAKQDLIQKVVERRKLRQKSFYSK